MKSCVAIVGLVLLAACWRTAPAAAGGGESVPLSVPDVRVDCPAIQTAFSPSSYLTMTLELPPQEPIPGVNIPCKPTWPPPYPGDLAWNKPTFASSYYKGHYPTYSTSTSAGDAWLSAGSTGSWFYVDLGEPKTIQTIITALFVDSNISLTPRTTFIASNDLKTWQRVVEERNVLNMCNGWKPRTLILSQEVTARYIGLYATGWDGAWADQRVFVVLPPLPRRAWVMIGGW